VQQAVILSDDQNAWEVAMIDDQSRWHLAAREAKWQEDEKRFAWPEFIGERSSWPGPVW
jgi:hypothetical protein